LAETSAEPTVRRTCKRAKQYFAAAVKKRLIDENPFDDVPTADRANTSRQQFVSRADITKVIDACPDWEWRLIFAMARYGGLRIPSEILGMRWEDINWEHNRFTVRSPKTEHIEGKDRRLVPLFRELQPYLLDALEHAADGQQYVFDRMRQFQRENLRTQALRIIRNAGVEPWMKTFHNLRSSRQTELVEDYPEHVVAAWLGNSVEIARKHYLQVTDEHFDRAVMSEQDAPGEAAQKAAHEVAQNAAQQAHAPSRSEWKDGSSADVSANVHAAQCDVNTKRCGSLRTAPDTPTGSRTPVSRMRT
jgi:integrase